MNAFRYHVEDVRVLKITHGKEACIDCIVFPTRGARPHANECAGGRDHMLMNALGDG